MDAAKKTFICFGAHPDDIEFSCTGMADRLLKDGYEGYFVITTNGENGYKDVNTTREERIETRKREQRRVAAAMGISDVFFLDYKDGFLEYTENLRADYVKILKKYRPEIIFSFDPANREFYNINLFHRDHRVVSEAVFDACFGAKNKFMYPGEPHRVEKIYCYGSHAPDYFIDITDFMERKLELLSYHESQFADFSKVTEYIKDYVSKQSDEYQYSEAFRVIEILQIS